MIIRNEIFENDMNEIYSRFNRWDFLKDKKVLVTGATGMLASYFIAFLFWLNEKHALNIKVIAFVRSKEKFDKIFSDYYYKKYCDIYVNDTKYPLDFDFSVDYIIHSASIANPKLYAKIPVDVMMPNIVGTFNLLDYARDHMNKDGAFLYFSSGDIYGKPINDCIIDETNIGSIDPLDLHSCYGESKRAGETLCMSYNKQYGVPAKIARICHTYSPSVDLENDPRVFSSFVKNIVNNEDIVMNSDGSGIRAFLYITDAILAFIYIMIYGKSGEAYNVSNCNQKYSILDLATHLVNIYKDRGLKVVRKDRDSSDSYIENKNQIGKDCVPVDGKLRELGWEPYVTIDDGFKRVIDYKISLNNSK